MFRRRSLQPPPVSDGPSDGSIGEPDPAPVEAKSHMHPWKPLVLSLDGGGVRGLSSLYILRRIMRRIQELEDEEENPERISGQEQVNRKLPLPCDYFDFIIGTSTGGLIALMLGRLRMDVNEAIQQYFIICNKIFRPHAYVGHYDHKRFERAINDVVKRFCRCHGGICDYPGTHHLRQFDHLEFDDDGEKPEKINGTCKVAVLSQRKAHGEHLDNQYLLRTYNHRSRQLHRKMNTILNLGQVDRSTVKIWEACRATSAAPFYFRKILIEGHWHIDGGVGDNNPSAHAWNEARAMDHTDPGGPQKVAMLVSIGTGKTKPCTKFGGLLVLAKYARKAITETQRAHETTREYASYSGADYFRFDVRPRTEAEKGLAEIKLDQCQKTKKKKKSNETDDKGKGKQTETQNGITDVNGGGSGGGSNSSDNGNGNGNGNGSGNGNGTARNHHIDAVLAEMDTQNDLNATEKVKGGYKPHKYDYTTFQEIKTFTDDYCNSRHYSFGPQVNEEAQNVQAEIEKCAAILFEYSRRRRALDPYRWERFRRHPDPQHESNIGATETQT